MRYRVMLADDEPLMRKALQSLVDWNSLECEVVYVAKNGEEIIEQLQKNVPDILVTDIKMPGKDGIEVAKYIWDNRLQTKVILLTAYADFSYAQSAIRYNVVEYVTKIGAFDGLLRAVENCKSIIESEKKSLLKEIRTVKTENFFKGIYDGSIYDDISVKFDELGISFDRYAIIFFRFLMDDNVERQRKKKIYDSLQNFFKMAFMDHIVHGLFLQRDVYGLVLECGGTEFATEKSLMKVCLDTMDTMDNFMELFAYAGISRIYQEKESMPQAFCEAGTALEYSYHSENEKVNVYRKEMDEKKPVVVSTAVKKQISEECLEYIEKHFEENIAVADIARALGVSLSYLSRNFKESTGGTVIQTINRKKMEKAEEYLLNTDLKVYEIAEMLGFENISYFSRFFKKNKGVSPKEFKEQRGNQQ